MKNSYDIFIKKDLITYMGNKRSLLNEIEAQIKDIIHNNNMDNIVFADVFSGSGVVSRLSKKYANTIYSNDLEYYSYIINSAYLSNPSDQKLKEISKEVNNLNKRIHAEPVRNGFIRKTYSPKNIKNIKEGERVFYTPKNAVYIDSAIKYINEITDNSIRDLLMANLLIGSSVHVNTAGIFKGFYKNSDTNLGQFGGNGENALKRILGDIEVKMPILYPTKSSIFVSQKDAQAFAEETKGIDIAYLDPPYNQHPYGSNYFMLNLIAKNEKPLSISKVSGIPENWNRSDYNKSAFAKEALIKLVNTLDAKFIIISYNSEGFIKYDEFVRELSKAGSIIKIVQIKYNTYRGSRNLNNRDLHVKEYLFVLSKKRSK